VSLSILKKKKKIMHKYKKKKKECKIEVTAIHVFAMASCRNGLGDVTFEGKSIWMNPYGHLPGDMYGYLPFFGWMSIAYLTVAFIWFLLNAFFWKELLYVQVSLIFPFVSMEKKKNVNKIVKHGFGT
ncbi:hypothetical protein RFI_02916, partial [Reticulomyxa filosa]